MARSFNGTSDLIDTASLPSGDTSSIIWVGAWIRTTDSSGAIISRDNGTGSGRVIQLKVASGKINLVMFASGGSPVRSLTGAVTVNDGNWHHVIGGYDGSVMRIYIDGAADGTLTTSVGTNLASKGLRFAAHVSGVTQDFLSGTIAEAFLRYSAITLQEAKALFNGLPVSHLNPDHYWPLWGNDSPEPDIGKATRVSGTLTGTSKASGGPRVIPDLLVVP